MIEKNVDYLLGIINQLLDFQKLESSALQLNLKKCNVNALVSDIFNQFSGVRISCTRLIKKLIFDLYISFSLVV